MDKRPLNLLLTDDDKDDRLFFKEALDEISIATNLKTFVDGVFLMNYLIDEMDTLPDLLFIDINMPRKTGYDCLLEIKQNEKLKHLPVIIFSTSLSKQQLNDLYENGACYYIRKPGEFSDLKKIILKALQLMENPTNTQPSKESFAITIN